MVESAYFNTFTFETLLRLYNKWADAKIIRGRFVSLDSYELVRAVRASSLIVKLKTSRGLVSSSTLLRLFSALYLVKYKITKLSR